LLGRCHEPESIVKLPAVNIGVSAAPALLAKGARRSLKSPALDIPQTLAIIAGNGTYPQAMARAARAAGVARIAVAAFQNETDPALTPLVEDLEWLRVGQLGKLLGILKKSGATHAVMSGQIHPRNLFDLRPDIKALVVLAKLKRRNAESIFGAIADEMKAIGVELLPATTFMEEHLAPAGLIAGPALKPRVEDDVRYGFHIAKESSRLDIGQTVVVKNGTVLAVEAFEGTNAAMKRGGELGRKDAIMVKVSKPDQDFRFDVPVIGPLTLEAAHDARIRAIGVEAGKTLLLEREKLAALAEQHRISIFGLTI
jgi:UDP-2,3-diacylglucosamine hydrolase